MSSGRPMGNPSRELQATVQLVGPLEAVGLTPLAG